MSALDKVVAGFIHFRENTFKKNQALFESLAEAQCPRIMVIACCDSRVDPAIITHAHPGDLFIVRNVANLVPSSAQATPNQSTGAALEFAVFHLHVEHIIVLGHAHCGGIRALLSGHPHLGEERDFINRWMRTAHAVRERTLSMLAGQPVEEQARYLEQEAVKTSLANLMTYRWVRERVEDGRLALHGWYFDITRGEMYRYDAAAGAFVLLAE